MGVYHPNPEAILCGLIGRKLEDKGTTYESYTAQLLPGEQLWLGTDNGSWFLVILLDDQSEFERVYYRREGKGPYNFYALSDAS
jgi:hypothetical protein